MGNTMGNFHLYLPNAGGAALFFLVLAPFFNRKMRKHGRGARMGNSMRNFYSYSPNAGGAALFFLVFAI